MAQRYRAGFHPDGGKNPTQKEQGFYQGVAWRRVRIQALERSHYLCQNCLRENRITPATEVHHILPLEEHPELALVLDNLEPLCWRCHEMTKNHGKITPTPPAGVRVVRIKNGEGEN